MLARGTIQRISNGGSTQVWQPANSNLDQLSSMTLNANEAVITDNMSMLTTIPMTTMRANMNIPTKTSELANDSGFITTAAHNFYAKLIS